MDIKMHSIMAGPDGCADAGETVQVSSEKGKLLLEGKFASKTTPRFPARETQAVDPRVIEQREREEAAQRQRDEAAREAAATTSDAVSNALQQLDPTEDDDWTGGGKPAMDRVKEITGSQSITRAKLDEMFPDFRRPVEANADAKTVAATATTATAAPRSNKP